MKNKLTTEEQALQSKLNEASFSYDEANWAEMQQSLAAKSTGFGPLLKAAIGLIALTGIVLLMNTVYSDTSSVLESESTTERTDSKQEVSTKTEVNTESHILETTMNEEIQTSPSQLEKVNQTAQTNKTSSAEKPIKLSEQTADNSEGRTQNEDKDNTIAVGEMADNFELNSIDLASPACMNTEVDFMANTTGNKENVRFDWFVDGNQISGSEGRNSYTFNNGGSYSVMAKAYNDKGELLAKQSLTVSIAAAPVLDFIATDFKDPFYDHNVNLKISFPVEGEYMWFIDPKERVQFGKEIAWTFIEEGEYPMTVRHKSPSGCTTSYTQTVSMQKDFLEVFPQQFTPNNDGKNDEFVLEVFQQRNDKFELNVFDLSGNLVFKSNDPNKNWNGRLFNTGELLPFGTYVWTVKIENENGRKKVFKDKIAIFKID